MDARSLAHAHSAAPALNRGLAILAALGNRPPLSLEVLSSELRLPKASVFRLLGTLQEIGMVRKTPEKSYEALCVLRPVFDTRILFKERLTRRMAALCKESGCTVEWYEASSDGMKLIEQVNPDTELRVQAKPGFLRPWRGEFDAVSRLGHAFYAEAPSPSELREYVANGLLKKLPRAKARIMLSEAQRDRGAFDEHYNTNGVRRFAVPILESGRFRGVLALAEAFHFAENPEPEVQLQKLRSVAEAI